MIWNELSSQIDKQLKIHPTMDIHSKQGTKVVFKYPNNGSEFDSNLSVKELLYNGIYTVRNINVGQSRSYVELEEKPGIEFNTVHFANVKEEK